MLACRTLFLCLIIFLSTSPLAAQLRFKASAEYLAPLMKRSDQYNFGIGGSLGIGFPLAERFDLNAGLGYTHLQGVRVEDHYLRYHIEDIASIPLNIVVRYRLDETFFLEAGGGPMALTRPESDFGAHYSAGAGLRFNRFEISGRLMQWNTGGFVNFAALRLSTSL